jgi:hypothetical protein
LEIGNRIVRPDFVPPQTVAVGSPANVEVAAGTIRGRKSLKGRTRNRCVVAATRCYPLRTLRRSPSQPRLCPPELNSEGYYTGLPARLRPSTAASWETWAT